MFSLRRILFFSVIALGFFVSTVVMGNIFMAKRPVKNREWTRAAKVWTARSCVGEAGFDAIDECMAIAWVYATRATEARKPYLWIVKRYSAALKRHSSHTRPWLLQLDHTMQKPKDWPNLNWRIHKHLWRTMLKSLDQWALGYVPNPLPEANHYGSRGDAQRARYVRRWKKLDAPEGFKNWFFNSRVTKKKNEIDWSSSTYWRTGYFPSKKVNNDMETGIIYFPKKKKGILKKGERQVGNLIIDN